jgi:hypothetical protein
MIANKCGLLSYDPATVMREAAILIQENRANLNSINKSTTDTLNEYVNENWNNILKLKSTDDLRVSGSNPVGLETLVVPTAQPRQHLVARYETDTKIICLLPKPLKEWCIRQHINYASFTADMQAGLGAVRKKVRLGKGTNLNLPPTDAIVIDCKLFDGLMEVGPEDNDGSKKEED